MSAQGQQQQGQQAQQQHDPQALQAAAQFGQVLQQHGIQPGFLGAILRFAQDNAGQILALVQGLVGALGQGGGGGTPPGAGAAPGGAQGAGS